VLTAVSAATTIPVVAATPAAPVGATQAVEFVARPGADPWTIAQQIAGPHAFAQRLPQGGAIQSPAQDQKLARTWLVPVSPGTGTQALAFALQDLDVESASIVRWPPLVSHPL
jgi:hypothetical protein